MTGRLWPLCVALGICVPIATAQDGAPAGPQIETTFETNETIPGQAVPLRITVYAPTYFPEAPIWPSIEAPNLLVMLPSKSTTPVSKRVGRDTWAGVSRRYMISPMIPGTFTLPERDVVVTYADPNTNEPVKAVLKTDALTLTGTVPAGAEGLDPFIAADDLSLSQDVIGEPGSMVPGDSVVRTVTARVTGTSPMFLPPLIAPAAIEGVRVYFDEPSLEVSEDRGDLSGTRSERVTLVAEAGGMGDVPELRIDWYNLSSRAVETTSLDGFTVAVDGPPAMAPRVERDWRAVLALSLAGLAGAAMLSALAWSLAPRVRAFAAALRAAWQHSRSHAYRALRRAIAERNHAEVRPALSRWMKMTDVLDRREIDAIDAALLALGAARFGMRGSDEERAFDDLSSAVVAAHNAARRVRSGGSALPPLNPAGSGMAR